MSPEMPKGKGKRERRKRVILGSGCLASSQREILIYQAHDSKKKEDQGMASHMNSTAVRLLTLAACALIAAFVPVHASPEPTSRTVPLDIRPGGVVETFTEAIVS